MGINKNLRLNQTFIFKGNKYIIAEGDSCKGCHFNINGRGCLNITGIEDLPLYSPIVREDRKNIIFIKL